MKHSATDHGWGLVVFKVCLALFHKCTHSFLPVFLKMRNFERVYKVIRPHSCVEMFHNSFRLQYSAMCQSGFRQGKSEHLFPLCWLAFFVKIRSRCQVHLAEVLGKSRLWTRLYYSLPMGRLSKIWLSFSGILVALCVCSVVMDWA